MRPYTIFVCKQHTNSIEELRSHDMFLGKMKYLGFISKTILVWLLLKKMKHCCNLEKPLSETGILNFGVPQKSILGPILQSSHHFLKVLK